MRQESNPYTLAQLKNKFYVVKGIVALSLGHEDEAMDNFLDCLADKNDFDPRLVKDCLEKLAEICEKKVISDPKYHNHLAPINAIIDTKYKDNNKEIVILIN